MRLFILSIYLFFVVSAVAQTLTPTRLQMLNNSTKAMVNKRLDKNGENCSIILVDVVGQNNLKFKEAVGETEYSLNEYTVYVPVGTSQLTCSLNGAFVCEAIFDDFGLEIEKNRTYRLTLETDSKKRSAVFYVIPSSAKVTIETEGKVKTVQMDENGSGMMELNSGTYNYSVSANGFETENGTFVLDEDNIISRNEIQLNEIKYDLMIHCSVIDANLFIDDYSMGIISDSMLVQLPEGKHKVRIVKEGYYDFEKNVILPLESSQYNVELKEMKTKIITHRKERTKSSISMRRHLNLTFDGLTLSNDLFKSGTLKYTVSGCQYAAGFLAFREGFGWGVAGISKEFAPNIDDYYESLVEHKTLFPFYADIPLQTGVSVPLDKYNRYNLIIYGGVYGSYYYLGHRAQSLTSEINESTVSTHTFDWGIRVNAYLYLKKFILGFEGNKSLCSNNGFDMNFGVSIGMRVFGNKD